MSTRIDSPVQFLKGVGPKRSQGLSQANLHTVQDLLLYFPRRYLDRSNITPISALSVGDEATVIGEVRASGMLKGRKARFEATIDDGTGLLHLVFFHQPRIFERTLKKGVFIACTGRIQVYQELQMVHPEFELLDSPDAELGPDRGRLVPLYPGSAELSARHIDSRMFRKLIQPLLESDLPDDLTDPLPDHVRNRFGLPSLAQAIRQIHFPDDLESAERARQRFAFDELFALQVHLVQRRAGMTGSDKPHRYQKAGAEERQLLDALPFTLTNDQKRAVRQIIADMQATRPMQRLLQGDVGSGKTVVAAFAIQLAVRSGFQAALMAPTEILAEQHTESLTRLLEPAGITPTLLTGSCSAAERREILEGLASGRISMVVGTHALIQKNVIFRNLTLAVIDEQHRFGVGQRAQLSARGNATDVLVMTATPIPRTLQLTLYGDLDCTSLRELPPGRTPVVTRIIKENDHPTLWRWLNDRFDKGDQAFLVYPLIEESEAQDLKAATVEFDRLKSDVFPGRKLALVHGRTPTDLRRQVMDAFRKGETHLLVATTVIEIGVDIPNANIMIIEHADRFGLSQLHQLRGRIRRGTKQSYCIAVSTASGGPQFERLKIFKGTSDGFKIAEADLDIRGPGELLGARQHGLPDLRMANLARDQDLLEKARKLAHEVHLEDPDLDKPEWAALKRSVVEKRSLWTAG